MLLLYLNINLFQYKVFQYDVSKSVKVLGYVLSNEYDTFSYCIMSIKSKKSSKTIMSRSSLCENLHLFLSQEL